jgi:integrase
MLSKVQAYVAARRESGFILKSEAKRFVNFARFADERGHCGPMTVELAIAWATASKGGREITAARRMELLRGFAQYCQHFDPATQVPPPQLFGPARRGRLTPHICTDREIRSLLNAAATLRPLGGLRAVTCMTIFGLLAACGLRISEATNLQLGDVDLENGRLYIRNSKYGKSRWVPLHPTTTRALRHYAQRRYRGLPKATTDAFFIFDHGRAATPQSIRHAFKHLRRQLGWKARGGHPHVRIHDLRHLFITSRLRLWYEEGVNIDTRILSLSTYVGHVGVAKTYWYLTATSELMALAARRGERLMTGGAS